MKALAVMFVPLFACNAILGIEDLQIKPDAGARASEQREQNTMGASDAGQETEPAAGSGGSAEQPRRDAPKAGSGSAPKPAADGGTAQPKAAGDSGASTPGSAGAAGAAAAVSPVSGTLIDYRRRKLPGVSVRIGESQTMTDAEGKFTLPDVPSRYDVTALISTSVRNSATTLVWQFQGLTRRDPTLQVYRGLPDRFGEVMIHTDNVTFPLAADQTILVGWASPDGDYSLDVSTVDVQFLSPIWSGPTASTGTAHALLLSTVNGLPSDYIAHDSQSLLMTADTQSQVSFDLGGSKPNVAPVRGTVTGTALGDRRNELYLRFGDDTTLQIADQWSAPDNFEYPAPSLPGANLTVVAKSVVTGGIAAA